MQRINRELLALLFVAILAVAGLALLQAGSDQEARDEVEAVQRNTRLASDAHFYVGGHQFVVPFILLQNYARMSQGFSFDRAADVERLRNKGESFLDVAASAATAPTINRMTITGSMYGWPDSRGFCRLLSRSWAASACDNPWSVIGQALPYNRFTLISLGELQNERQCISPAKATPLTPGRATVICLVDGAGPGETRFYKAALQLDGDLGALWTVWEKDGQGETASAMADREGAAIFAFVRHAIGPQEDFVSLRKALCQLRRPGSVDHPQRGAEC